MMTLDEFFASEQNGADLKETGFRRLYVRKSLRTLSWSGRPVLWHECIDIANVVATRPGRGAFTRLLGRIKRDHPGWGIYVENCHNPRLGPALLRRGFLATDDPISFLLPAAVPLRTPAHASGGRRKNVPSYSIPAK
jgi:hypothetical protein